MRKNILSICTSGILIAPTLSFLAFHSGGKKDLMYPWLTGIQGRTLSTTTALDAKLTAADVLKNPKWPENWPFTAKDFRRQDESTDDYFYSQPRLVYHIDDSAVKALTKYYKTVFFNDATILDICSSWVSHFPQDVKFKKAIGMGMNEYELSQNKQINEFVVRDLNKDPSFPFEANTFDFVTCVVSVDYLTKPLEVFKEINRVLKPGGIAIMSQSNRCFPTKAIDIWLNTNDLEHIYIIGSYFHYAGGFEKPESLDISPNPGWSDPMFIIQGKKALPSK